MPAKPSPPSPPAPLDPTPPLPATPRAKLLNDAEVRGARRNIDQCMTAVRVAAAPADGAAAADTAIGSGVKRQGRRA